MAVASVRDKPTTSRFDNCDHYHKRNGKPILEQGYIVTDWLSKHQLYVFVEDDVPAATTADILSKALDDYIKWMQYKGPSTYNAVSVNYPNTQSFLIAPAMWCGPNERLADYLAMETEEGISERIN
jgi:hypothetical protein